MTATYEDPPPFPKVKRKHVSCGHQRFIISRNRRDAWCWVCQGPVRTVRVRRFWKGRRVPLDGSLAVLTFW